jgi:hypothetical protein
VSFNKLLNIALSRRDDIEAFFYLLVFLRKGELLWSDVSLKQVSKAQESISPIVECLYSEEENVVQKEFFDGLPK